MHTNFSKSLARITPLFNNPKLFNLQNRCLSHLFSSQLNSYKINSIQSKNKFQFSQKKSDSFKKKISKQQLFKAEQEQRIKQQPDQDPTTYDKASGWGGKIFMAAGVLRLFGLVAYVQNKSKNKGKDLEQTITGMVSIKQTKKIVGGQWSLINHKGKPFSSTDLAGSYYLIYFGFTKCPDICPTTLIKLGRAMKLIRKMPQYHYLNLKIVFVSCDPDRDTPQRMKQYLKNFDQQIIGVTGTSNKDPQLLNCMKSFKIYANKIPLQNGQYSMDHTTITYLMDDENKYVDHLNPNLTEQQMAKAIVNRILDHDYNRIQQRKAEDAKK